MPVYLCKPGMNSLEPWRHGIPVYAQPFPLRGTIGVSSSSLGNDMDRLDVSPPHGSNANSTNAIAPVLGTATAIHPDGPQRLGLIREESRTPPNSETSSLTDRPAQNWTESDPLATTTATTTATTASAIRRIRHAEVILVDDVVYRYSNYWLRLRWPGTNGGFAGYVCLVAHTNTMPRNIDVGQKVKDTDTTMDANDRANPASDDADEEPTAESSQRRDATSTHPSNSMEETRAPSPGFYAANSEEQTLRCLRTGVTFPSSPALKLLANYDDGLVPPVTIPLEGQLVFCRICRDGLHDDDENGETEAGENPLMAPCECSGSMAFVHYLCVEQWRCRSRHPEARHGTHCETCSKPYALPPPSSRPVSSQVEEEWLEAMPPHVMAALRQPHLGWQLGAALVRRRWLRPIAPIIVSPLVALYCRARRLLKKRGVSRRRWACSLCRRRARWKCVRCLRSYYCSRQCQNVSWHIVHKHVCYKPSRFWWSVVVYGALLFVLIPGILKDPLFYDLAFSFIPPSFYVMAVLGGGIATLFKRLGGFDMRGRTLELVVVVFTALLVSVSWGIVWGMFGQPEACIGIVGASHESSNYVKSLDKFVLGPAKAYFLFLDTSAMRHDRLRRLLCTSKDGGCFPHLSNASPALLLSSDACVGDVQFVSGIWLAAGITLALSTLFKKRRRGNARPHQD